MNAAISSGFSQTRMAKVRAPKISAFWTPVSAAYSALDASAVSTPAARAAGIQHAARATTAKSAGAAKSSRVTGA